MKTTKYPAWGVLVRAPLDQVRKILKPLDASYDAEQMVYRCRGDWTAMFYMEPSDSSVSDAADLLHASGLHPLYRFDFSRYEFLTYRYERDGIHDDRDPDYVLGEVGIDYPGKDPAVALDPKMAIAYREVTIVENASPLEVRMAVPEHKLEPVPGPRGAILYDPPADARFLLWERSQSRVFDLLYYPSTDKFRFRIMRGETCLGTFRPGETQTWDGTPFLPDVDGETTPERILDLFGINRTFLDPLPSSS